LWLGGSKPACFDGTRFFSLADYGLPSPEVYDFSEDSSGAIWIGAVTGVYRFANGRMEEVSTGAASSLIAVTPDMAVAVLGLGRQTKPFLGRIQPELCACAGAGLKAEA
jgi:hypothetical protein